MAPTPMKRIQVDFNSRAHEGLVRSRTSLADSQLDVGDEVVAYDPDEGLEAWARVAELDAGTGLVFLAVDWHSFEDVDRSNVGRWDQVGQQVETNVGAEASHEAHGWIFTVGRVEAHR